MADRPKEQLEALKRQVERETALSPEPLLADAAQQGRQAADFMSGLVAEQAGAVAELVRGKPLTAVAIALLGGYALGRIGRYL